MGSAAKGELHVPDHTQTVRRHFSASREVIEAVLADEGVIASICEIAARLERCLRAGGKILLAGNGGSAADALHIAGELVGRLYFDRAPLPAIALAANAAVLTALGNDYGFEQVFERQVRALGRPGDALIALSTSGRSPNILTAVAAAKELGLVTIAFTGAGSGPLASACDLALRVPSTATPLIQQVHMAAAHAICEIVEAALFGDKRA